MKNFKPKYGLLVAAFVLTLAAPLARLGVARAAGESLPTPADKSALLGQTVAITDLKIANASSASLNMNIYVPSGVLAFGSTAGLTFTSSNSGNNLNFTGTGTAINTALSTLTYTPSASGTFAIESSIGNTSGDSYNLANRHVYRVVQPGGAGISWTNAKTAAEAMTYGGVNGYLATITSQSEYNFIVSRINTSGWIGASDAQTEGQWKWVTGPETGNLFWTGTWDSSVSGAPNGGTGQLVPGQFANWSVGEPNNNGGSGPSENCGEMRFTSGVNGQWNDLDCASLDSAYVVEFGAPGNLPQVPYAKFNVTVAALPNGGDANNDGIADSTQTNVKSVPNPLTNTYTTLASGNGCATTTSTIGAESANSAQDTSYDYPAGLMNFTLTCGTNGATTTVKQYYYGVTGNFVARKYNPTTKVYTTLNNTTITDQTIGGQQVKVLSYNITDGGSRDADGVANGVIVDPVGLAAVIASPVVASAAATVAAPNTGLPTQNLQKYVAALAASVVLLGVGLVAKQRTTLARK